MHYHGCHARSYRSRDAGLRPRHQRAVRHSVDRPDAGCRRCSSQRLRAPSFSSARRVTVLCGKGNNGGDGMMAAWLLADAGLDVTTVLLGSPDGLKGDAAVAWRELTEPGRGTIHVITAAGELARLKDALAADLIVDAVVGTGFKPPLKGLALAALDWIKASRAPVLSVDLPSGWPADGSSASVNAPVYPSDAVITFTAPKPAHVFGQLTRGWNQPVVVAPIGSPQSAIVSTQKLSWAGSAITLALTPRTADANKGRFGHVLVAGGTFGAAGGKAGAPSMSALAALRVGAGLVTAAVPASAMGAVGAIAPELMTWGLETSAAGSISDENLAPESSRGAHCRQNSAGHRAGSGASAGDGEVYQRLSCGHKNARCR